MRRFKNLKRSPESLIVNKGPSYHSESGNTRIKRGKKLEETPPGPTVSPSVSYTSKKTPPDHIVNPPTKICLACRIQSASSSITALIPIAHRPAVQTMQHSDKDSTLSRADDDIVHNEEQQHQESTDATRNLPEILKPKAVNKASVDGKQGVDILSILTLESTRTR